MENVNYGPTNVKFSIFYLIIAMENIALGTEKICVYSLCYVRQARARILFKCT